MTTEGHELLLLPFETRTKLISSVHILYITFISQMNCVRFKTLLLFLVHLNNVVSVPIFHIPKHEVSLAKSFLCMCFKLANTNVVHQASVQENGQNSCAGDQSTYSQIDHLYICETCLKRCPFFPICRHVLCCSDSLYFNCKFIVHVHVISS